ncbi:transporter substrate-binding domain-containing protein [Aliiroseovarius crassostreae]|uniref:transporter substrate-binding domain-containing protein n=1 Tax=Aliiroseovarius crassostreae TaxID=154981 RepID=UPI00223B620A|nr:transporter substrate-binding domain-containing protein [Aliiroseovarius crassostreae]
MIPYIRNLPMLIGLVLLLVPQALAAQSNTGSALVFATVERAPFAYRDGDQIAGFSVELMRDIGREIGRPVEFKLAPRFADMLGLVELGQVDGAVANISITAAREEVMDFSQPIFEAGLQIMLPPEDGDSGSLFAALFNRDIALAILGAAALLYGGGMMMWLFERRRQPYFDRPLKDAMFTSFWWALNLVVNGGFEERVPQSRGGRIFGVLLVISSLFIVSIFVARITAAMTVAAISGNIDSLADLDGKRIGTTAGSTAALFLDQREIAHGDFDDLNVLLKAFEAQELDAVVFDGPLLAWYLTENGSQSGRLLPRVFKRENYGIALPSGSALTEPINRALLSLRESGRYDQLRRKYFGPSS